MSDKYNINTLIQSHKKGKRLKYVFFWGHQKNKNSVTKTCFSQWYGAKFVENDITYPTAEHYMMAEKARLFGDKDTEKRIIQSGHPGQAKKLGRQVEGFKQEIWEQHRFDIVTRGSILKFAQNDELKTFLLNTGNRILVEASPLDKVWGIGLAADHPHAENPEYWKGLNLLGFALMAARDALQ